MEVNTGLVIIQMVDIDFEEKSINMNVEFIMEWQDQFIKINNNGFSNNVRLLDIKEIWSPDLYIYGLKTFTRRESSSIVLRKDDNGYVRVSYTFEVSFPIKAFSFDKLFYKQSTLMNMHLLHCRQTSLCNVTLTLEIFPFTSRVVPSSRK